MGILNIMEGIRRKLSDTDIYDIWWYYLRSRWSQSDIARRFGVSLGVIIHVIDKKGAYANQKPHNIERYEDVSVIQPLKPYRKYR
jgi:hypothetical protein